jgi:hypothetical protein
MPIRAVLITFAFLCANQLLVFEIRKTVKRTFTHGSIFFTAPTEGRRAIFIRFAAGGLRATE